MSKGLVLVEERGEAPNQVLYHQAFVGGADLFLRFAQACSERFSLAPQAPASREVFNGSGVADMFGQALGRLAAHQAHGVIDGTQKCRPLVKDSGVFVP